MVRGLGMLEKFTQLNLCTLNCAWELQMRNEEIPQTQQGALYDTRDRVILNLKGSLHFAPGR